MSKNIAIIFSILVILSITSLSTISNAKRVIATENYFQSALAPQISLLSVDDRETRCYFGYCFVDLPDEEANELISNGFAIEDRPIFRLHRTESLSLTSVYKLWNESFLDTNLTGTGVKVAIIDSGISVNHADINYTFNDPNNWKYCYNAIMGLNASAYDSLSVCNDTFGHGTFVAGIVAGRYQGNITKCFEGYECGVAPNVTLIVIKAFEGGYAYLSDIMDSINYAVANGADIISMSFGAEVNISCYDPEISILTNTVDNITKNGIITVASAGNGLRNPDGTITTEGTVFPPACSKNVIAVGSTDKQGEISFFSSRGPTDDGRTKPDLVAPGEDIR
ncbi:MAG: S8 family serine peptidase, partial [Candidatus Aenigmarchaeota archaeon]|nr:S8 family serine peptidase [Candidatus Aenigmarchaeota archaeon]